MHGSLPISVGDIGLQFGVSSGSRGGIGGGSTGHYGRIALILLTGRRRKLGRTDFSKLKFYFHAKLVDFDH